MTGIYRITNKINGKVYIGQSNDIKRRWSEEKCGLVNKHLQRAFDKYGIENFEFEILCESDEDYLDQLEIFAIAVSESNNKEKGYNITLGGGGTRGFHHTEDSKRKNAEAHKGRKATKETRKKISDSNKGRHWKTGKPAWNRGKSPDEEARKNMSEAHKGKHWKLVDGKRVWY